MKELILDHLKQTIAYFNDFKTFSLSYHTKSLKEIQDKLLDAKAFTETSESSIIIFNNAFIDFLNGESKMFIKHDFNNAVKDCIKENDIYSILHLQDFNNNEIPNQILIKQNSILSENLLIFEAHSFVFKEPDKLNFYFHVLAIEFVNPLNNKLISNLFEYVLHTYNYIFILIDTYAKSILFANLFEKNILEIVKTHFTDQEFENYLNSWIDGSVRHEDWLNFYYIDVFENLKNYDISDEQWNAIRQHRFTLFCKVVDNNVKHKFIDPFMELLLLNNGIQIAKRDLSLITDLINGNIDEFKAVRLKKVFGIKDCTQAIIMIEDVLRNHYSDDENYEIWHEKSYLQIKTMFRYKEFLENYLNDQDEKPHIIVPNLIEEIIIDSQDSPHQLNGLENPIQEKKQELNPYPRIFRDLKAFKLFEYLLDQFDGTEIKHSDCSFIFGQMKKDEYILEGVKDKEFRDFLRNGFNASLSGETLLYQIDRTKLKTLEFCKSDSRMREYLRASRGKM